MIVRERPGPLAMFFVFRGSVLMRIWPQVLGVGFLSAAVVALHRHAPHVMPAVSAAPFAQITIALSIFLGFRNSSCYDRWWEARKLWGAIVQTARDLVRQTAVLGEAPERRAILMNVVEFARLSERQLRGDKDPRTADHALTEAELTVSALERAGRLTMVEAKILHDSILRLAAALLACERLANTPLPLAYTLLLHRTAYIFCFILPFGFEDSLGWLTPLSTALVAYTFFGLDALAEELEEPFGLHPNDLPIAAYATNIEIALRSALGDTDLPPAPVPVNYVLT